LKQNSSLRLIYKIESKMLRKAKWNLTLPLEEALRDFPECVVSISDSQCLRFINDINGENDIDGKIRSLQNKIRIEKRKKNSPESRIWIREYYRALYETQFQKNYVCVVMANNKDYDRANQGFSINGIRFRRLLGTNGGIKNSTIVYVNEDIYPELKRRLDNGRNMTKELVPAKLEAYQALICSGSTPLPQPNGIIVVKDCITHFKEDVILIDDSGSGEPSLTYVKDYEIEHNDSDGYGLMLPSYSRRINEFFGGDPDKTISGFNSRCSWIKGMVYTFDYIEFADKVAGSFIIKDVWGTERDIRDAEVILTESMLKLWDSYDSWEDYWCNCQKNGYSLSAAKTTPEELEPVRDLNYQFIQDIDMSDDELKELCSPTISEINDVLGLDYRKSLVFLAGYGLNGSSALNLEDDYIKALMIEPQMINDPYVRRNIHSMIKKRIDCAKKGSVRVDANYAMISGDPYALCQSMFELPVTGLLCAGECYHKYWIDKGANEIVCFRAPMLCSNNISKLSLCTSQDALHWFQYIETALVLNAWDTATEAASGADHDGDTFMSTDNAVLINRIEHKPPLICLQRKASKKIVTEADIIEANKLAFNDDIGIVTNHATSMINVRAGFDSSSNEYKILTYRIQATQNYQQNCIDKAKGIIANDMPKYWFSIRDIPHDGNEKINKSIVAAYKPYFMIYVYPQLKSKLNKYKNDNRHKLIRRFSEYGVKTIDELRRLPNPTRDIKEFLRYYDDGIGVGTNACTVNRICWLIEDEFNAKSIRQKLDEGFDYQILKCNTEYSKSDYNKIKLLYSEYTNERDSYFQRVRLGTNDDGPNYTKEDFIRRFKSEAESICPNEQELCDIVLDLCYCKEGSKQFAWDVAGETIIQNLLDRHNGELAYPELGGNDFQYNGKMFTMKKIKVGGTNDHSE